MFFFIAFIAFIRHRTVTFFFILNGHRFDVSNGWIYPGRSFGKHTEYTSRIWHARAGHIFYRSMSEQGSAWYIWYMRTRHGSEASQSISMINQILLKLVTFDDSAMYKVFVTWHGLHVSCIAFGPA